MADAEDLSIYSTQIAKGSFWGLLGNMGLKSVSFIYLVLIARSVSQNDIGVFYLALSILSIPSIIDDLGLPAAISRYIPYFESKGEISKIRGLLKASYWIVFLTGMIFTTLFFFGADKIGELFLKICFESNRETNPPLVDAIKFLSFFLVLNNLFSLFTSYLQSRFAIKQSQLLLNLQNILKLLLTLVCFYFFGPSIFSLAFSFLLALLVVVVLSIYFVIKTDKSLPKSTTEIDSRNLINEIIPFGLALGAISSLSALITSSDKILLGYLTSPFLAAQIVATYAIATNMATLLNSISGAIGIVFFPLLSRLVGKDDHTSIKKIMETSTRWLLFLMIPPTIIFISFSDNILTYLFSSAYTSGGLSLAIFTLGIFLNSIYNAVSYALASVRKIRYEIYIVLVGGIANIILNVALIPYLGMEGAAISSFLSYVFVALMLRHYGKRFFGFTLPSQTFRILFAGVLSFVIMYISRPLVVFTIPFFGIYDSSIAYLIKFIYVGLLGILILLSFCFFVIFCTYLKCFHKEDIAIIKKILKKAPLPSNLLIRFEQFFSSGISN